jgi:hypothetical protein
MSWASDTIIEYAAGYKYQLIKDYSLAVGIVPKIPFTTPFLQLDSDGRLTIRAGYAWDGPSGPTIDTQNFMRGSLVHDALYQLIREGLLPFSAKAAADKLLRELCREDGMSALRAWWVYVAVDKFGKDASKRQLPKILTAP